MNNLEHKRVAIVDYKLGNMFSVLQACKHVGLNAALTSDIKEIESADALILPGVGAFSEAMEYLKENKLIEPLRDFAKSNKPFLGICLGMQLLFEESDEHGTTAGLGLVKGRVEKFPLKHEGISMRIPNIGWNRIYNDGKSVWAGTPLENIDNLSYMYFVHSYYCKPNNKEDELATSSYNNFKYCSAIKNNNIVAFQFHPEKSGNIGLEIYRNLKKMIK